MLFTSALSLSGENTVSAGIRLAAINALSIKRRGIEELTYIRRSYVLLDKHIVSRLDRLAIWHESFEVFSAREAGHVISIRRYCEQLRQVLRNERACSVRADALYNQLYHL
jgi:hypothetical protein